CALYTVFSDPTRLKILSVLSLSELCVTDISRLLKINQTTVSHQLHNLNRMGLVRSKRQGKIKFYKISDIVVSKLLYYGVEYLGY
ncbi:MAG: metalloregulator ArsR/SmtB family transcription factor, partial [Clostridia bacterium]